MTELAMIICHNAKVDAAWRATPSRPSSEVFGRTQEIRDE
jgi:hypothetical protein